MSQGKNFIGEVFFKTSRSGGKGGQHVNKVETQVEAWWCLNNTSFFSEAEKSILSNVLKNRINKDGCLIVRSNATRSQLENKQIAVQRLTSLVEQSLIVPKKRKTTKTPLRVKIRRSEAKQQQSYKKQLRRKDW